MKRTNQCPKCGSTDIIADAKAVDRGENHAQWDLTVATFRNPEALLFKGQMTSKVSAWVCSACGYIELYADTPQFLKPPPGPS